MKKKNLNNLFVCWIFLVCLFISGCVKNSFNNESLTPITPNPTQNIEIVNTIIENPEPQIINEYGNCSFTAKCSNNIQGIWYFVSPDWDAQYTVENINDYAKNLMVTINGNTIYLMNVPGTLDGWMIYCEYPNGLVTIPVTITVNHFIDETDIYLN